MPDYKLTFIVEAKDKGASNVLEKAAGGLGALAGGLGGIAQYAIGGLLTGGIQKIGQALGGMAKGAIEAVGHAQTLEMAMEGLLTESLMYQKVTETMQVAMRLTDQESKKLANALTQQQKLTATLAQQEVELTEAKRRKNESDAHYLARMEKMRVTIETNKQRLAGYTAQVATLESKQGRLTNVTETSWQQMMDFGAANDIAKDQVKDLLSFVEQLAIVSPFETEQVEEVARIGLSAKLSADQVKEFSGAFLDYAAVHGITSSNLAFAADQFLQLRKIGKLTAIDLRQLRRLGIDVEQILGVKMGMGVAEFNEKIKHSPGLMDQLFESFVEMSGEGTAGAAQRMTTTIGGMMSTVDDIITVGSRKLFRPVIEALSPFFSELLGIVSDFVVSGKIAELGRKIGDTFSAFLSGTPADFPWEDIFPPWLAERMYTLAEGFEDVRDWLQTNIPIAIAKVSEFWTDTLKPALEEWGPVLTEDVLPALRDLGMWLLENLPVAIDTAATFWKETLQPAIEDIQQFLQEDLIPIIEDVADWLEVNIPAAIEVARQFWEETLLPAITGVWQFADEYLVPLFEAIRELFEVTGALAIEIFAGLWENTLEPALRTVWRLIERHLLPILDDIWTTVEEDVQPILEAFAKFLEDTLVKAFNAVKDAIKSVTGWIGDLTSKIANIDLPDWLKPGSPTPFELGLRGIASALQEVNQALGSSPLMVTAGAGGGGGTHHHYHLTIQSSAPSEPVIADFQMMQAMAAG